MVWAMLAVIYSVIAAVSLWLHVRCIIHVAVGFCEVKYRRLFFLGISKYSLMTTGSHFIIPLIQKRIMLDDAPSAVFPVDRNAGHAASTDIVFSRTSEGKENMLVQAEFTYYVEDVVTFVRDEFTPLTPPSLVAYTRAREILEKAVSMAHSTDGDDNIPRIIAAVLDKVCDEHNKDSALKVNIGNLQRCAVVKEILSTHRKRADRR